MLETKVSPRGQTVVPQEVRRRLGIAPQSRLRWEVRDGVAVVTPVPQDAVRAALGLLAGEGPSTEELLAERRRERDREAVLGEA